MREPSGAHTGACTSSWRSVSRRASPGASTGDTYSCATSPSRTDVNASQRPSGDQRGVASRLGPNVRRRGSVDPSTGTAQTALRGSRLSSSTHATTYATVTPSGDRRGSPALARRKTSSGCMPAIVLLLSDLLHGGVREQDALLPHLREPDRCLGVLPVAGHLHDHALAPPLVHDRVAFLDRRGLPLGDGGHRWCFPSPLDRHLAAPPRQSDDRVPTALPAVALLPSAVPRARALLDPRFGLLRLHEVVGDLAEEA